MKVPPLRVIPFAFVLLPAAAIAWASVGTVGFYNSEEHKLIGDRGADTVKVPESVKFPELVTFKPISGQLYIAGMKAAKMLSVGYQTNADDAWQTDTDSIQDNCYFTGPISATNTFKQAEYNVKIWIPDAKLAPSKLLSVPGYTAPNAMYPFTFGELVAFYGDYRQIPYCEGGKCFVTNGDIPKVRFVSQGPRDRFCPSAKSAGSYIASIGSGLVPPFG